MKTLFQPIAGSVTAPSGFLGAGVFCDIKRLGTGKGSQKKFKRDLALVYSRVPAAVAGMFTTNQIGAAPVKVSIPRAKQSKAQAIVINSGNANACTGPQGLRDARAMTALTSRELNIPDRHVLVGSTGRIGVPLPMSNVKKGILDAAKSLGETQEHARHAAEAILTSDTYAKEFAVEFQLAGGRVRMGGIAKGAGMIEPGMSPNGARPASMPLHATMLAVITTDARVESRTLKSALKEAVAQSFNRITIDGDMSTNDSVFLLANGEAGNPTLNRSDAKGMAVFQQALNRVTLELAKMIVQDGEGASRYITVHLSGARTVAEADAAARAVANSQLVKTSWCGGDPNWGRILDALGYSPAKVTEEKVDIAYRSADKRQAKKIYSLKKGRPVSDQSAALKQIVKQKAFELHIHLNLGPGRTTIYTTDLTEAYVDFNKGE